MLAYHFPPDNVSGAVRPHRFARYLSQAGHSVRVVAAAAMPGQENGYVYRAADETARIRQWSLPGLTERAGRKFLAPHDEGIVWISRAVSRAAALHRESPFDVIFSTAPPFTTHVAALRLKRRLGIRWVADFRDPLAGNPFRRHPIQLRLDPWLERRVFRHADAIIANTSTVAEMWRGRYPQYTGKIQVIWNGFDPADGFGPLPPASAGYKVIAHVGEIYGDRNPGPLLSAFRRLIERGALDPKAYRIRLIGFIAPDTPMDRAAISWLEERGCLEIRSTVPREEARAETARADYLLLLDSAAGLQVPAKLFDYVRVGRPILAMTPPRSAVAAILRQCGIPHTILWRESDDEVDRQLLAHLQLPAQPSPPSNWFYENFNAISQTRTFSALLRGIPAA